MNIFVLDEDPINAAQMLCDKHVVKMIVESAQLLCSAHWANAGWAPYRKTHINHPCSVWVRESLSNYEWLATHALALCLEYSFRYKKIHKTQDVVFWAILNVPSNLVRKGLTPFKQAMPDKYKCSNAVTAYQNYYANEKISFLKYKSGKIPEFLRGCLNGID